ncbi:hypothetical protein AB4P97_11465 [Pseudomonas sp. A1230]|jgi:hypothetical protein|uniref:Uncharacterized protein n=1 Tax=Pseudomonas shahriarae TaxID=2745512 RepID=A0A9X4BYP3_9PSED|nr:MULTISPECIES: hypothetical protein [Pseudomonas]MBK3466925.1 hypothetical protein [Pseudomonas sp. MF6776]MDD1007018.1 hypothetical protein [Pseudomonas shahriarae]CEL29682.1 hypothetical protein SRM1_03036 [Pseudomonas fluorescens]
MKEQLDILNTLASLIYEQAPGSCDEIVYKAKTDPDEGWVESSFFYHKDGERHSVFLTDACESEASELVSKLNEVMFAYTGGRWRSFVLKFDSNLKVSTDFNY